MTNGENIPVARNQKERLVENTDGYDDLSPWLMMNQRMSFNSIVRSLTYIEIRPNNDIQSQTGSLLRAKSSAGPRGFLKMLIILHITYCSIILPVNPDACLLVK